MCEILTKESSLIFIQSNYQTNKVNHLLITSLEYSFCAALRPI